ncbi:MAG TPA: hypothetical protein DDX39_09530 [Bacteroidales bacterium]|nr:MAG: hypothetical protein A2W98_15435 [Bacteroidetes bacterium GWF2_33_38]OFY76443.1 MAG: hypothetical protein A2265_04950 [Bacteroidetes bacterium RIFOXYA12_FULL_33_9]HBF88869.1 hypothetical protein [Bacteroidales bacterium]
MNTIKFTKVLLSILLSIGISFSSFSANHFTENFSGGPTDYFTGLHTFSSGLTWDIASIKGESAANAVGGVGGAARFLINTSAYLISPSVNTLGAITFQYRELNAIGGGSFKVQKSVGGGAFVDIATQSFSGITYQTFTLDVNDSSNDIRIKIVGTNTTYLIVDELTLTTVSTDPELNTSVSSLSGFSYVETYGPSTAQSYNLSGLNLDGSNVTITSPTNYEISLSSGSGYVSSPSFLTLSAYSGVSTPIYVRLKSGLAVADYNSELVVNAGGGAASINVTCSGSVSAIPPASLTVSASSLTGFTYVVGNGPSASQSYNLSGSYLTGYPDNITVTAPTNYEVSADNVSFSTSLNIAYTTSSLLSTTIYVRLKSGLAIASYNSELAVNAGGGATSQNVTCSGSVTDIPPAVLSVTPSSLSGFSYIINLGPSESQIYTLSGTNLTGYPDNILVTAPTNFEISTDDATFSTSLNIPYTSATLASTTIYVRLVADLAVNSYVGEVITNEGGGASTIGVTCSGEVTDVPAFCATELIISEYIEGSSNNKAIEIYNNTGGFITLDGYYRIGIISNGGSWTESSIALTGTIADNEVFVIANTSASTAILDVANLTSGSLTFNGDDAVALQKYDGLIWTNIDQIGTDGTDPGTGWAVAGTANATVDKTLVRKNTITSGNADWVTSAGTTTDDSEWIINATDYVADLGTHSMDCGSSPSPELTVFPTILSGFTYVESNGPSSEQSYVISGTNLDGSNVVITPSTNFEISQSSGTGFSSSPITLTAFDGTATTIYVRLIVGLSINTYNSEVISNAGGGATTLDVTCNGEVTAIPSPELAVFPTTLTGFTYVEGNGPSSEQSYVISGTNLDGSDVVITPSINYEISQSSGTGFSSSSITLTSFDGTATTIYVRLVAGLPINSYNAEIITNAGGGATTLDVTCNGEVTAVPSPELTVFPTTLTGYTYVEGNGPSAEQSYVISGTNLDGSDVVITPSTNYEISQSSGIGFSSSSITLTAFDGTATTIYVRLIAGLSINFYNAEIITNAGGGAIALDVTCSGEVTDVSTSTCENFDDQTSNTYSNVGFSMSSGDWTCNAAGNFAYANTNMGSYAFTINDDIVGAHITTPALNTCGTVSFKYAYINGTETNVFVLQKSTDEISFTDVDTHELTALANLNYVDYSFTINDLSSTVYIRILSDDQNAHLFIEDFCWSAYSLNVSEQIENFERMLVFPNPTSGLFNINLNNDSDILSVEIIDISGQVIYENFNSETIEFNANSGVYFVKVRTKTNLFVEKLIVK